MKLLEAIAIAKSLLDSELYSGQFSIIVDEYKPGILEVKFSDL